MKIVSGKIYIDPKNYFTPEHFKEYYSKNLHGKKGGGIDNLSPKRFYELYESDFPKIAEKCLNGSYHFSCYREKTVSKGANKFPRVLSIPTMRDRLVLGVLNEYLQEVYRNKGYKQPIPNHEILRVISYLNSQPEDKPISFLKTDFHNYYGTIKRSILLNKLKPDIEPNILELINRAISTPTIPHGSNSKNPLRKKNGIPQGISISNILAYVYLKDFDDNYGSKWADIYIRYVDDILYINPNVPFLFNKMKRNLCASRLNLKFSQSKINQGIIGEKQLDFIGYEIKSNRIVSVRKKNSTKFITQIAGIAKKCIDGFTENSRRPKFIESYESYISYYKDEINLKINGFRASNHNYGWMAYYQGINDVHLLYTMDRVIHNRILKKVPKLIKDEVNFLVKVYYDLHDHGGEHYLMNFDKIESPDKRRNFLIAKGFDCDGKDDDSINYLFQRYISNLIRQTELSIGRIS